MQQGLKGGFLGALGALLVMPIFFPSLRLFFFLPYLVGQCYYQSRLATVTRAVCCGALVDSFSASTPFGFYALATGLTLYFCYPLKRQFFAEKLSTVPLITYFCSVVLSLLSVLLFWLCGGQLPLNIRWLFTDALGMGILDALYAFCFVLPLRFMQFLQRSMRRGF